MDTGTPRRIPHHAIKPALRKHLRKRLFPIKHIDAVARFVIEFWQVGLVVEVGADQGISALDVVAEVGQDALAFLRKSRWSCCWVSPL